MILERLVQIEQKEVTIQTDTWRGAVKEGVLHHSWKLLWVMH